MKIQTVAIYGDSISTRYYGDGGYEKHLKERLQIEKIYNHAIGASALTDGTPDSLIRLLDDENNLHSDADLVILWHGTNDWYWGAAVGTLCAEDLEDEGTFIGAMNHAIEKIRRASPKAKIMYLTPLWRHQQPDGCEKIGDAWDLPNKVGACLCDYDRAIFAMSRKLCFSVVDMRTLTNFNAINAPVYQPDHVHPSAQGYEVIADILCGFIKTTFGV